MAFDLKPEADDTDLPEDKAPEEAAPAAEAKPEERGEVVPIKKPLSRREAAAQELKSQLETLTKNVESLTSGIAQRDQELGRLRGFMEQQAQQPRYYQPPPQAPQIPDPNVLMREAQQALDNRDFSGYQEKLAAAVEARTLRSLAPAFQEIQQRLQQPQGNPMPPELGAMFASHPEVAMAPNAMALLQAKNLELEARGIQAGPVRLRQVFAEVDAIVKAGKKQNGQQQYSQASAAALSGVPTSRNSGGGGGSEGPGITLTAAEAEVARRLERSGVMSRADYARGLAEQDPSRVRQ